MAKRQVLNALDTVQEKITEEPQKFADNVFNAMNEFANMILSKNQKGGARSQLVRNGIKALIGGTDPATFRPTVSPQFVSSKMPELTPESISIDLAYKNTKQAMHALDAKAREIASIVGPVAFIHEMKEDPGIGPIPPYLPVKITIPKNSILPTITYMIEGLRLLVTTGPLESDFLRKLLSVIQSILDITSGNWKNGLLSLLGLFGKYPLLIGVFGRLFRQVWNFVSPDLQNELEDNVFEATKSVFAGFWLTMITTFAPQKFLEMIDNILGKMKPIAENLNKSLENAELAAARTADKLGLVVKFPRIDMNDIPSADDLQNLLTILRRKEVQCEPSVRSIVSPLYEQPIMKLMLELLNIPSSDEALAESCKGVDVSIENSVKELFKPTITKKQQGGYKYNINGDRYTTNSNSISNNNSSINVNEVLSYIEPLYEFPHGPRKYKYKYRRRGGSNSNSNMNISNNSSVDNKEPVYYIDTLHEFPHGPRKYEYKYYNHNINHNINDNHNVINIQVNENNRNNERNQANFNAAADGILEIDQRERERDEREERQEREREREREREGF